MSFTSAAFLFGFLPVFLTAYYLPWFNSPQKRAIILIIFSIGFYAWVAPAGCIFLILMILLHWKVGKYLYNSKNCCLRQRKSIFCLVMIFDVSVLSLFKYAQFIVNSIRGLMGFSLVELGLALPLGMSFIIFEMISYLIDNYRAVDSLDNTLLNTSAFFLAFPKLTMGPLVRFRDFSIKTIKQNFDWNTMEYGTRRFSMGLAKKVIIADGLAAIVDIAFSAVNTECMSVLLAVLGAVAYTLQIYFDFSGYADMTVGLGSMLGIELPENFNYPYISRSVSEFWRRWHITLGSWFRDYVYFPLGGSRKKSKFSLLRNLFVVWILTGLWHGAAWTFILWGTMYFVLISLEKLNKIEEFSGIFGYIYTAIFTILGWVIFRSESFTQLSGYLKALVGINTALYNHTALKLLSSNWYLFAIGIILSVPVFEWGKRSSGVLLQDTVAGIVTRFLVYLLLFIVAAAFAVSSDFMPFIYNNF